ncbi:GroES-like protein [Mycena sp. CBHHK59/15]|nr:GroES-like protein [Mycena sp. CBHHK59/15]
MSQKAIIIPSVQAPFEITSRDIPTPSPGEVLVKIMSVALNPVNWAQRQRNFFIEGYPAVVGNDIAGVVEQVGAGVKGFAKGDRVFAQTVGGGFQQYTTLPAAVLMRIPEKSSFEVVATFPVTFTTACVGLFAPAPIGLGLNPTFSWDKPHQGKSALVIGGSTSTGQFAIQLLKFLGFTKIVVYASKTHFDYLGTLGGTDFIDRTAVPVDAIPAHVGKVHVVFDSTFTGALDAAYDCAAEGGRIVTVRPRAKSDRTRPDVTLVRVHGYYAGPDVVKFKAIGYLAVPEHTVFGKLIIENLPAMLEKGAIRGNRYEVLPNGLAGILEGLERMEKGGVSGVKLVAHPQDV